MVQHQNQIKIPCEQLIFLGNEKDKSRLDLLKRYIALNYPEDFSIDPSKLQEYFERLKAHNRKNSYLRNLKRVFKKSITQTIEAQIAISKREEIQYLYFTLDVWDRIFSEIRIKKSRNYFKNKNAPTPNEIVELVNAIENPVHALMTALTYQGGFRNGEVRNIKLTDISRRVTQKELDNGSIVDIDLIYVCSKNQNEKMVPILSTFIDFAIEIGKPKIFLFESTWGRPFGERNFQRIVAKAGLEALRKKTSPHLLRHSLATQLYEETKDIINSSRILGHDPQVFANTYAHPKLKYDSVKVSNSSEFQGVIKQKKESA